MHILRRVAENPPLWTLPRMISNSLFSLNFRRAILKGLVKMPASIQLKVLSQLTPELYADPDAGKEDVAVVPCSPLPAFTWESVLNSLRENGMAVCDGIFGQEMCRAVASEMRELELQPGKMGLAWQEESMRGDKYVWLKSEIAQSGTALGNLMQRMEEWRVQLNDIAKLELATCKFMAACYPGKGARYVRHSDVSALVPDRRVTAILYLNEQWLPSHGGCLHIDNAKGERVEVQPVIDRMLFFCSELMHEVRPAHQPRMAITGWYYGPQDIHDHLLPFQ